MAEDSMLTLVGDYLPESPFISPKRISKDMVVANLECVIGDGVAAQKAHSIILGSDSLEHVEKSRVSAFNLANNHVYDAGVDAFDRMIERLNSLEDIQFYGLKDRPFAKLNCNGLRIAVIGCLEPCRARGPKLIREEDVTDLILQIRSRFDRVYVTPHWGREGELACHPSPRQLRRAREWIAAGADGIFGHHSHTIHGHETISGKPVFYSLGNYQFDHVEGHDYPLAAFGLVVRIDPSLDSPAVVIHKSFVHQHAAGAVPVEPDVAAQLEQHFEQVSVDLMHWNALAWARHVGPVYISKSRNSWRKRFRQNPTRTLPLWTVWNCLPSTILLRLGAVLKARGFLNRIEELGRTLPARPRSHPS